MFLKSPYKYWYMNYGQGLEEQPEKESFRVGSMVHCAILEPERFAKDYRVGEFKDKRSKAWKEFSANCYKDGVIGITTTDKEMVDGMRQSIKALPMAYTLLCRGGEAEVTAISHDEKTGIQLRSRFDFLPDGGQQNIIVDLKTCRSAMPQGFAYSCRDYDYDLQVAFYMLNARLCGLPVSEFIFIAIEKTPPYEARAYAISEKDLKHAFNRLRKGIDKFHAYKEEFGTSPDKPWPSNKEHIQILNLNRKDD